MKSDTWIKLIVTYNRSIIGVIYFQLDPKTQSAYINFSAIKPEVGIFAGD